MIRRVRWTLAVMLLTVQGTWAGVPDVASPSTTPTEESASGTLEKRGVPLQPAMRPQAVAPSGMQQQVTPLQRMAPSTAPSGGLPVARVEIVSFTAFTHSWCRGEEPPVKLVAKLRITNRETFGLLVPWIVTYVNGDPLAQGTVSLAPGRTHEIDVQAAQPLTGEVVASIDPMNLMFANLAPLNRRTAHSQYQGTDRRCVDHKKNDEKKDEAPR